jgi:hypothetical protein
LKRARPAASVSHRSASIGWTAKGHVSVPLRISRRLLSALLVAFSSHGDRCASARRKRIETASNQPRNHCEHTANAPGSVAFIPKNG